MDLIHHFPHLQLLIGLERQEEEVEFQNNISQLSFAEKEERAIALLDLIVCDEQWSLGGYFLIAFQKEDNTYLPFFTFENGDLVILNDKSNEHFRLPTGTVYEKTRKRLIVAFAESLPEWAYAGACYLQVDSSLATYKKMSKALLQVASQQSNRLSQLRDILLGNAKPSMGDKENVNFFNNLNTFQQQAVNIALAAKDVALVHGPPGTGKTTVLIEYIMQEVKNKKRVLATAPSNVACDNLLSLLVSNNINTVRLGHPARISKGLREHTLDFMLNHTEIGQQIKLLQKELHKIFQEYDYAKEPRKRQLKGEIRLLKKEIKLFKKNNLNYVLHNAQVIVGTHAACSMRELNDLFFDVLVMDEASQSTEPAAWIPILHAQKIVFAGDHLQLPPTVRSKEAENKGLNKTIFERLINFVPDECKVLLRYQYRMHEKIMGFSSREFYHSLLIADDSVKDHRLFDLPQIERGEETEKVICFVDTSGCGYEEELEKGSESRFNKDEAKILIDQLNALLKAKVNPEDIGIISAYSAQVRFLRYQIPDEKIEIYSVDKFQGREKEVILLSLVRSNLSGELGFLADTKRMNVAMTRARRKLWVVGDGATLSCLPFYQDFIDYTASIGAHYSAWQ